MLESLDRVQNRVLARVLVRILALNLVYLVTEKTKTEEGTLYQQI